MIGFLSSGDFAWASLRNPRSFGDLAAVALGLFAEGQGLVAVSWGWLGPWKLGATRPLGIRSGEPLVEI